MLNDLLITSGQSSAFTTIKCDLPVFEFLCILPVLKTLFLLSFEEELFYIFAGSCLNPAV